MSVCYKFVQSSSLSSANISSKNAWDFDWVFTEGVLLKNNNFAYNKNIAKEPNR